MKSNPVGKRAAAKFAKAIGGGSAVSWKDFVPEGLQKLGAFSVPASKRARKVFGKACLAFAQAGLPPPDRVSADGCGGFVLAWRSSGSLWHSFDCDEFGYGQFQVCTPGQDPDFFDA